MCDPLSLGMAALSTVGSIAASSAQAAAAEDVTNKQNAANAQWVAYQENIHRQEQLAETQARNQANQAREDTLAKVSPEAQAATQSAEQQRLNNTYETSSEKGTGRAPAGVDATGGNAYALSGEQTGVGGGAPGSMGNLSGQVNQATAQARNRVAALATANSYGGSFGGLGTTIPIAFQRGANDINLQNEIRKSDLQTYGVEQQVQPIHYALGPEYGTMGAIGQALAGVAGKALGAAAAGGFGGGGWGGGGGVSADYGGGNWGGTGASESDVMGSLNAPMWNQWG